jgi:phage terminase small subunit
MTPRKQRFIEEYARAQNGKAAALAAGYAPRAAAPMASKLLRRADVQAALIAAGVPLAFTTYGPKPATRIAKGLTARQERFIEHYMILGKGAEAARRAGYSARSAPSIADKLLHTPVVMAALDEANAARAKRLTLDGDQVLIELATLVRADLSRVIDWGPAGVSVKAAEDLAPEDRAAIAAIDAVSHAGGTRVKVKLFDKLRALELLAKHVFAREARGTGSPTLIDGREARDVLRERLERIRATLKGER